MPITAARSAKTKTAELARKARLFSLAGDKTRIRIICFMFENKNACVSDIATNLELSIATVSHHLQLLRDNGLCDTTREGTTICYSLIDSDFTKKIRSIICN